MTSFDLKQKVRTLPSATILATKSTMPATLFATFSCKFGLIAVILSPPFLVMSLLVSSCEIKMMFSYSRLTSLFSVFRNSVLTLSHALKESSDSWVIPI